jgi:receptor expression-enhancing protein 5/6
MENFVEKKTNVRRLYIVMGLAAFVALYLMVGYGADFLCNFIGFLYPAYRSVKAIESKEKDDDTKWLTYWVVYSAFALMEFFTDIFLWWIPLYWFFKALFLLYCMIPGPYNGSVKIYTSIIRPFVLKHQSKIDQTLDKAGDMAADVISDAQGAAADHIAKQMVDSSKSD